MHHFRLWIAGLASRKPCAPHAPRRGEAGMLGVNYYNPELEAIGDRYQVWRCRGETDRDLAFKIAVEIATRMEQLQADLDRTVAFNKASRP